MAFMSIRIERIRLVGPLAILLALCGCNAQRSHFPSLAIRPAERAYNGGQTSAPAQSTGEAASAQLIAKVAALREAALAAHARFTAQQGDAAKLVNAAKGAAPGTEAWSRAAIALAGLTSARGEGMIPLSDLDRLQIAATEKAAIGSDADLAAITPARREVGDLLAAEDRTIAALGSQLGS
jgi:hypothetical protein